MLIRFSVANFRSFNEEVVFSMIPGRSRQHENHVIKADSPDGIDVLRMGLLYGANASGKSNLIKAMAFAQKFIVEGVRPKQSIPTEPFRLDPACIEKPSRFEFELIVDGIAYAYGFELDRKSIQSEWLIQIGKSGETSVFERTFCLPNPHIVFGDNLIDDEPFLQFVRRSTRANQLFLTNAIEHNVKIIENVFEWFRTKLAIFSPDSSYRHVEDSLYKTSIFVEYQNSFLKKLNTGIDHVRLDLVPPESIDRITSPLVDGNMALEHIFLNEHFSKSDKKNRRFATLNESGDIEVYDVKTVRMDNLGKEIAFDFGDESDGTQRLIELYPILFISTGLTVVIDELERSLHPNIVRTLLKAVMFETSENQLLVTTHEATLLDLDLLRRDEIWFIEKSPSGASTLYSLEEFKPRHDLDIRKGYLQGRFGAIPVFGNALQLNGEAE